MRNTVVGDHRRPGRTPSRGSSGGYGTATSLWVERVSVEPGEALEWRGDHADEVVWVRAGALRQQEQGGWTAGSGDAVVVEFGVPLVVVADRGADVVWFGSRGQEDWGLLGPPTGQRSAYPVRSDERTVLSAELGDGGTVATSFWADSTRDTCRAALLEVAGSAGHHAPAHSHSGDEIIYVVEGALRIAQDVIDTDMSIFVPAGQRYRFSADGPYSFINFRRDASTITIRPGSVPLLETAAGLRSAESTLGNR